jgi:hypothetical protein
MGKKEILLKPIIQSIPVFAMGVFKIPKGLINDAMSGFREDQKKNALVCMVEYVYS